MYSIRYLFLTCAVLFFTLPEANAQLIKDAENLAESFDRPLGDTLVFSGLSSDIQKITYTLNGDPTVNKLPSNILPLIIGEYEFSNIDDSKVKMTLIQEGKKYPVIAGDELKLNNDPNKLFWYNKKINRKSALPATNDVLRLTNLGPDTSVIIYYYDVFDNEESFRDTFKISQNVDLNRLTRDGDHVRILSNSNIELKTASLTDTIIVAKDGFLDISARGSEFFYNSPGKRMDVVKEGLNARLCNILRHTDFVNASRFTGMPYNEVYSYFGSNPYFKRYLGDLQAPSLYSNGMRYWFPDCKITGDPAYDWQNYLYGDAILSVERRIDMGNLANRWENDQAAVEQFSYISQQNDSQQKEFDPILDETAIIIGLSDFIIERAQEELNITFLQRFRNYLEANPEVKTLFPATVQLFEEFDLANYRLLLTNAKPAFKNDLENLGLGFSELLKLEDYARLKDSPEVFNLALFFEVVNMTYHNISLDTVMLRTYQNVHFRDQYLTREIADTLGLEFAQNLEPLNPFRDVVDGYSKLLQNSADNLDSTTTALLKELNEIKTNLIPDLTQFEARRFNNQLQALQEGASNLRSLVLYRLDLKTPDTITYYGKVSNLEEFGNSVDQYFSGEVSKARLLREANLGQYDDIFESFPQSQELISEGFFWGNQLIHSNFDQDLKSWETQLRQLEIATKKLKEEVFIARANRLGQALNDFRVKKLNLELGLKSTIDYYDSQLTSVTSTGNRNTLKQYDADIFALKYLLKVLEKRPDGLWKEIENITLSRTYPNDKKYAPAYYQVAQNLLGTGQIAFDDIYQKCLVKLEAINSIKSTTGFPNNPEGAQKYAEQLNRNVEFFSEVNNLFSKFSLDKNQLLRAVSNDYLDPDYLKNIDSLFQDYQADLAILKLQAKNTSRVAPGTSSGGATFPENIFFTQLKSMIDLPSYWTEADFVELNDIEDRLQRARTTNSNGESTGAEILQQLEKIEEAFATEEFKARKNAREMAKALELAIHLMYSFQNPAGEMKMLIVQDTSRVSYTEKRFIGGSPFTERIWQVDTLRVNNRDTLWHETQVDRWLNLAGFDSLMNDEMLRNAFLGLIYQRISSIQDLPELNAKGVATLTTKAFESFYYLETARKDLKTKKALNEKRDFDDYYPFLKSTIDLVNTAILTPIGNQPLGDKYPALRLVPELTKDGLAFYENLNNKRYASSVKNLVSLVRLIWEESDEYKTSKKCRKDREKALDAIVLYGSFMAEMVDAKSAEQVSGILKKYTVAPGSSRTKRESKHSFAVNSYLGLSGGMEYPTDDNGQLEASAYTGLAAPIGLTFSFGVLKQSSLSLHASVLDLGAVTAFRIDNPGVGQSRLPDLSFRNVLAPGAFLIFDFGKSPFSVGGGIQYGPQLREINTIEESAFRLNIIASVDVPLFQLYRKPRDKQQSAKKVDGADKRALRKEGKRNRKIKKDYTK